MNIKSFFLSVVMIGSLVGSVYAEPTPAGLFGFPYNENQVWSGCSSSGWVQYGDPDSHQYHMQYYSVAGKYHMGEDWNGQQGTCDGNSDEGAPLLAIADGQVVFLDNVGTVLGQGKRLYVRYSIPYANAVNDVMIFDIALLHLQGMGSGVSWSGSGTGSLVTKGQTIAYLGKTGTSLAHLHWEAQTDLTIPLGTNPYQNPLTVEHALKYRAPSLIVDDRSQSVEYTPIQGYWSVFSMQGNAPSSTAYVEYNGDRKSLKNAITAGWISANDIMFEDSGSWYWYSNVDYHFFENGKQYAVRTPIQGAKFVILVPQNNFQKDRARLDMLHAVKADSRFESVRTDTYGHNPNWGPSWELHWMAFNLPTGGIAYVNQATNKANPLVRYTAYYDPDLGQWTSWRQVDWNVLY